QWEGYRKPFISNNLIEALQLPEKQPSLRQVKEELNEIENRFNKKQIENMYEIKKFINDLPTLKDLKKSIEDLKEDK
ncbi:4364_t:CDS:1, partial [Dentiscutata heterogama]